MFLGTTDISNIGDPIVFLNLCTRSLINPIFLKWIAPASGTYTVDTCTPGGNNFDTILSVGTCEALQSKGCNDDNCPIFGSKVNFVATANEQYIITVGGFRWTSTPPNGLSLTGNAKLTISAASRQEAEELDTADPLLYPLSGSA